MKDLNTIPVPEGIKLLKVDGELVSYVDMNNLTDGVLTGKLENTVITVGTFSNTFSNEKAGTWNEQTVNEVCESLISHQNKTINVARAYGTRLPNGTLRVTVMIEKIDEKFQSAEDLKKAETSKKK